MYRNRWLQFFLFLLLAAIIPLAFGASEKTVVPLFLFSGQSNMVCLGSSVSDLPSADQTMEFENIKIHNRSDNARSEWSTLKPGFGGDAKHFGPELYFGKVLADSMPDTKFAFIKDATSGTYLGKSEGWLPPSSGGPGTLYKNMMDHIDKALDNFNDAFDTSKYTPRWAGFIWHQGEFDGWNDQGLANKYEENLTNLIKDLREMAGEDSMPAIIPMISGSMWQYKEIIQKAEIAVAEKLVNSDTTNTEGLAFSSDNIHYNAASQMKIGTNCALRWLAMEFTNEWWNVTVPVVYQTVPSTGTHIQSISAVVTVFDLSGRVVRSVMPSSSNNQLQQNSPAVLLLRSAIADNGQQRITKMLNVNR